jgi:uncharacterized membrane protein
MIIPTFIDGFTQMMYLRESNNKLRFFTGIIAGWGLGMVAKSLKWALIN